MRTTAVLGLIVLLVPACDQDTRFEDMNQNPTQANSLPPEYMITTIELAAAGTRYEMWRNNLIFTSAYVQHLAQTWYSGQVYSLGSSDWRHAFWNVQYNGAGDAARAPVKMLVDIIENYQDDPAEVNKVAAARILRAFVFHRLTDMHGDVPYTEAGRGFIDDNITPAFDAQQDIYLDMLNELEEAVASLDGSFNTLGSNDLIYGGDLDQWRKFGNSLMLRLAMRLVNRDASLAQQWAQKALTGGVITDNADNAVIHHATGPNTGPNGLNSNGNSDVFAVDSPRCSKTFVDYLKGGAIGNLAAGGVVDPRLRVFCAIGGDPSSPVSDTDPADQRGMPNGVSNSSELCDPNFAYSDPGVCTDGNPDYNLFSGIRGTVVAQLDDPTFYVTAAQTHFLLAEAAIRWGSGFGDPAAHYQAGVREAMTQLVEYDPSAEISDTEIDAWLFNNPYDAANGIEQVNTQYWVASFLNGYESWSNWRRVGYPVLEEINHPSGVTGGRIPLRQTYPGDERTFNSDNLREAETRQGVTGALDVTTPVWWDSN
jgi:hypothetical protein